MMNDSSRIIFFGTGALFSVAVLRCLNELDIVPSAIVIPEYPAASHMPLLDSIDLDVASKNPLSKIAEEMNVPLLYAPGKNNLPLARELKSFAPEFILVACWPYLIPEEVCSTAKKAALNLHPSLLPNYRGANPVEAQLKSAEKQLGVSLHLLNQTFDSGDIISQCKVDIADKCMTIEHVEKQAAEAGADLFVEAMDAYGTSKWQAYKQERI